jgi:hypothetical protein
MGKIFDKYQEDLDKMICPKCKKNLLVPDMGKKINALLQRMMEGDSLSSNDITALMEETELMKDSICKCKPFWASINWEMLT